MSDYKYHYVIKDKHGQVIDTAQDKLMRDLMVNWLCKYHGHSYMLGVVIERRRIAKNDWKARYC